MRRLLGVLLALVSFQAFGALLYEQDFESGIVRNAISGTSNLHTITPDGKSMSATFCYTKPTYLFNSFESTSVARTGTKALRVAMDATRIGAECGYTEKKHRAQFRPYDTPDVYGDRNDATTRADMGSTRWYGFSIYFPEGADGGTISSWWANTSQYTNFFQIMGVSPGDHTPELFLRLTGGGNVNLQSRYRVSSGQPEVLRSTDYGVVNKGAWNDFVIQHKRAYDNTGILKVWINGTLKMNLVNVPTAIYSAIGAHPDFGPYYGDGTGADGRPQMYVYYFDSIKVGDASSSYDEVKPAGPTLDPVDTGNATLIYSNDFQSGVFDMTDHVFAKKCREEQFTIVNDPLNPGSGNKVFQAYQRGDTGCMESTDIRYRTLLVPALTKGPGGQPFRVEKNAHSWLRFRMYVDPITLSGTVRKFIVSLDVGEPAVLIKGNNKLNVMPERYRVWNGSSYGPLIEKNISDHNLLPGWNTILIHQYKRISTQGGGIYRLWLNGNKVIDLSNIITGSDRAAAGKPESTYDIGIYHGNTKLSGVTRIYYDDIRIATGADAFSLFPESGTPADPEDPDPVVEDPVILSVNSGNAITAGQTTASFSTTTSPSASFVGCTVNNDHPNERFVNWNYSTKNSGIFYTTGLSASAPGMATAPIKCFYEPYETVLQMTLAKWSTITGTSEALFSGNKLGYTTGIVTTKTGVVERATNYYDMGSDVQAVTNDVVRFDFTYSTGADATNVLISLGDETTAGDKRLELYGPAGNLVLSSLNGGFGTGATVINRSMGDGVYRALLKYKVTSTTPVQTFKVRAGSRNATVGHVLNLHEVVYRKNATTKVVSSTVKFDTVDTTDPVISGCTMTVEKITVTESSSYTANMDCVTSEIGGRVYGMLTTSNTNPTAAQIIAKTGALWGGSYDVYRTALDFTVNNLEYRNYWFWMVHKDPADRLSNIAVMTFAVPAGTKKIKFHSGGKLFKSSGSNYTGEIDEFVLYASDPLRAPSNGVPPALVEFKDVAVTNGAFSLTEANATYGSLNALPLGQYYYTAYTFTGGTYKFASGTIALIAE